MIDNNPLIIIRYKDSEGNITERKISNIRVEDGYKIVAFCYIRDEYRTFRIANILEIIDPETGNVYKNPYKFFDIISESNIESLIYDILPAVRALKMFSKSIRGFSKRERMHIVNFIINNNEDIKIFSKEIIDEWIHNKLYFKFEWDNSIYVYDFTETDTFPNLIQLIKEIPDELMSACHDTALKIAKGSGRRPIPASIMNWINYNFATLDEKNNYKKMHVYYLQKGE